MLKSVLTSLFINKYLIKIINHIFCNRVYISLFICYFIQLKKLGCLSQKVYPHAQVYPWVYHKSENEKQSNIHLIGMIKKLRKLLKLFHEKQNFQRDGDSDIKRYLCVLWKQKITRASHWKISKKRTAIFPYTREMVFA